MIHAVYKTDGKLKHGVILGTCGDHCVQVKQKFGLMLLDFQY